MDGKDNKWPKGIILLLCIKHRGTYIHSQLKFNAFVDMSQHETN